MNDRIEQRRGSRGREDARNSEGVDRPVADGEVRKGVPPVRQDARSRRFLDDRLRSSRDYALFAASAGADIFDGEPIERFAAVGKMDERLLRMRAQDLREDQFREAISASATKRIAQEPTR